MSEADKRSVTTDALETLGKIITPNEKRDAIHLAVENAVAGHKLWPGDHVGRLTDGRYGATEVPLGIVDPFLGAQVQPGDHFWLVVYPRQITSLRHVWTHPDFPETAEIPKQPQRSREESEKWLRNFISGADCPNYDTVIAVASGQQLPGESTDDYYRCYNDGEYLHFGGRDAHGDIPPEFWDHLEVVTGKRITKRPSYFSCSC